MSELLKKVFNGDYILWITIGVLLLVSSVEMFSAISQEAFRQSNHLAPFLSHVYLLFFGFITMIIVHKFPYQYIRALNYLLLPTAFVLLILLYFVGVEANNAVRSLKIAGFEFQPMELAKFSVIAFISDMLAQNQKEGKASDKAFVPIIIVLSIFTLLIAPQNLSTAVMLFGIGVILMIIGRISFPKIAIIGITITVVLVSLYSISHFWQPSFLGRLNTWVNRVDDFAAELTKSADEKTYVINDKNFQIMHSKIAIAKGVNPAGPGNSTQRDFLPLAFSDFIYAIVIEEYGLYGGIFVMLLYLIILFRAGRIANKCDKAYPAILVIGLSLLIVIQAFISMAVSSSLGPVTGQPLPLISKGGTSILITSIYLGIILNISQAVMPKKEEQDETNVEENQQEQKNTTEEHKQITDIEEDNSNNIGE